MVALDGGNLDTLSELNRTLCRQAVLFFLSQCVFYQMEAEVLNPQMMADVNGNNKITNAELEVIKLQELVRKLEKQNEQLRTRANAVNNCSIGPHLQTSLSCLYGGTACPSDNLSSKYGISSPTQMHPCAPAPQCSTEEPFAYFQPSSVSPDAAGEDSVAAGATTVLDEVDILDINTVLPIGKPDSWLYVSPKAKLQVESVLSPLKWCRQVLDHPGPEVELAKMTLCHRLDQAKRWRGVRPYSCIEGLSTLSYPVLPYTKPAAITESPAPLPSSAQSFPQPTLPLRATCSRGDRTATFLSNTTLHNIGRRHAAISPQSSVDSEVGVSEVEDDSISMGYKLQDMTDVEVMARLQEESLRQDYASTSHTATASRRSSTFSLHSLRRSEMDLEEEDEDDDEDEDEGYDQLPPPQPRLFRTGSMQRGGLPHSHTFSSIRECRRSSITPQFSLSGLSQYSGTSSLTPETHTLYRNSTVPSPGQLTQRVQSVGNFPTTPRHPLKATAYVSPTVQQGPTSSSLSTSISLQSIPSSAALSHSLKPSSSLVPQPLKAIANQTAVTRSSLPRPASFVGTSGVQRASKIAQPTRSLLTPPKSVAALSALRDGSWKDGCY
ncbi:SLAIN motif-containing protein 1a isoform X3 [Etheostoma cragini]|uniref:SLAIN motif-containing protein 1a isoform X3 n=1 Tax=Etheostoma cragini TaxID=417921 RepID=UPI00155E668E|nr:SLAIN motif-containing protein 1a isoform X3 [Etheostoma cragini]